MLAGVEDRDDVRRWIGRHKTGQGFAFLGLEPAQIAEVGVVLKKPVLAGAGLIDAAVVAVDYLQQGQAVDLLLDAGEVVAVGDPLVDGPDGVTGQPGLERPFPELLVFEGIEPDLTGLDDALVEGDTGAVDHVPVRVEQGLDLIVFLHQHAHRVGLIVGAAPGHVVGTGGEVARRRAVGVVEALPLGELQDAGQSRPGHVIAGGDHGHVVVNPFHIHGGHIRLGG